MRPQLSPQPGAKENLCWATLRWPWRESNPVLDDLWLTHELTTFNPMHVRLKAIEGHAQPDADALLGERASDSDGPHR
jgi:hypothetical protein